MNILIVASEMQPYAKTGGLADVVGALPRALARRGNDVRVVLPRYACIDPEEHNLRVAMPEIWVNFPGKRVRGKVWLGFLPAQPGDAPVPVYFLDFPELFERAGLYGELGRDYADNGWRFAVFNMAIVWLLKALDWRPDILHCNDWQSAFLPIFLRSQVKYRYDRFFAGTRILFTIHNLAYQGLCGFDLLERIGLSPFLFKAERLEYWGLLNPLKGGIAYSDWISTVSPTYLREIQTREFGCGLDGFLGTRTDRLSGIINGVDGDEWNPIKDEYVAAPFSRSDLSGKAVCKQALQKRLRLEQDPDIPVVAMVNRLDEQKGVDLLLDSLPGMADLNVQFVILGSGRADYQARLEAFARKNRKWMRARMKFDAKLSHVIEAGADVFLMLSNYEPCGLNQMFSLKYGTVPVVHRTGGLADTVNDATPVALANGEADGFVYDEQSPVVFLDMLKQALAMYHDEPEEWRKLQVNGMAKDFSWERAAESYEGLYRHILSKPSIFVSEI